jgi:uncharacterized membrane protein YfcA
MFDAQALPLIVVMLAFFAGGLVKGVIGIGLPLVVVPIVATFSGPLNAIALMFVPAVTSNVMQAYQGGLRTSALVRFWPALIGVAVGGGLGAQILSGADRETAGIILAVVVVLFCGSQMLSKLPPISARAERWFTPIAGTTSGFVGGLTGFLGLTLVPYLLALRLAKEEFVATVAILYLAGVSALYVTLFVEGVFTSTLLLTSCLASLPTLAGVWLGSLLRRRVPEARFRKLLVIVLFVIALNLMRQSLFG